MRKNFTHEFHLWFTARLPLLMTGALLLSISHYSPVRASETESDVPGSRKISGVTLRKIHPTDLWAAIRMIAPSVNETNADTYGSDPNHIFSSVEVSGAKRWGPDNLLSSALPVFIIDGATVDARRVRDLDINDVESVEIRSDATALAGSGLRGGNGIIEIITVRPEAGSMRFSYHFDGALQWFDPGGYNLLNSAQKLSLEKSAGLYGGDAALLAGRERLVAEGTDKDWLKVPLTTAFQNRHRIGVSGGDEFVRFQMAARFSPAANGVMKGSKRDAYGADGYIEYRHGALLLSNRLSVDNIYAKASPYGTFDYFTTINPYYTPADGSGLYYPLLGEDTFNRQINPAYEASLGSFRKTEGYGIWNNFFAAYDMGRRFRIEGRFSFIKDKEQEDYYISPSSGLFEIAGVDDILSTGKYDIMHRNRTTREGSLTFRYDERRGFSGFGAALSANIFNGESDRDCYGGTGIPVDRMGFISFASAYDLSLKPEALRRYERKLSGILSGYYDYDGRYGASAWVNVDKSSQLASNNRVAWFYGASAKWNIHNEGFMKSSGIFRHLSLEAGLGTTGAVDFTEADHTVRFSYNTGNEYIYDYYLIGAAIHSLPNAELKPRTTFHTNVSLTASLRWFSLRVNCFNNTVKELLTISGAALATGYENTPANGGKILNRGIEYALWSQVINLGNGASLRLFTNGIHQKSTIGSIPVYFMEQYNKSVTDNFPICLAMGIRPSLLRKGESLNAIYAVRSAGLDDSGNERFLRRDGNTTYLWSPEDMVAVGDATPKLKGAFGIQTDWRQWSLNILFDYSLGGGKYNETLHRAQHADAAYNGDSRMSDASVRTPNAPQILATSRFVETNNELSLGSVRAGYAFRPETLTGLRIETLEIALTVNRLLNISSADYQRGIYYPCARTATLSLNVIF